MAQADVAAPARVRIAAVDVLRGVAIVAMVVYHFSWDLAAFGLISADVDTGAWRLLAQATGTSFLFLVGLGLALAARKGLGPRGPAKTAADLFGRILQLPPRRWITVGYQATAEYLDQRIGPFFRRVLFIGLGAIAVSIATYVIEPDQFVYFGILHLIAVASVLAVPFLWVPAWAAALAGVALIALGNLVATPFFNAPWLLWIGLATEVRPTVDYYPLLPWFGVVLLGVAAGKVAVAAGADRTAARWQPSDPVTRSLARAGRWSLVIYLLHQVILYGGLSLAAPYLPAPAPPPTAATDAVQLFMSQCLPVCAQAGANAAACTNECGCMYAGLNNADLLSTAPANFTPDQRMNFDAVTRQCAITAAPAAPAAPAANSK